MAYGMDSGKDRYRIRLWIRWSLCCPRNLDSVCCLEAVESEQDDVEDAAAADWGVASAPMLRAVVEVAEVRTEDLECTRVWTNSCCHRS